jgi:hypothetical protein
MKKYYTKFDECAIPDSSNRKSRDKSSILLPPDLIDYKEEKGGGQDCGDCPELA